jgi:hypothetical protein
MFRYCGIKDPEGFLVPYLKIDQRLERRRVNENQCYDMGK